MQTIEVTQELLTRALTVSEAEMLQIAPPIMKAMEANKMFAEHVERAVKNVSLIGVYGIKTTLIFGFIAGLRTIALGGKDAKPAKKAKVKRGN